MQSIKSRLTNVLWMIHIYVRKPLSTKIGGKPRVLLVIGIHIRILRLGYQERKSAVNVIALLLTYLLHCHEGYIKPEDSNNLPDQLPHLYTTMRCGNGCVRTIGAIWFYIMNTHKNKLYEELVSLVANAVLKSYWRYRNLQLHVHPYKVGHSFKGPVATDEWAKYDFGMPFKTFGQLPLRRKIIQVTTLVLYTAPEEILRWTMRPNAVPTTPPTAAHIWKWAEQNLLQHTYHSSYAPWCRNICWCHVHKRWYADQYESYFSQVSI
ncbi:hypothetical protein THRCLA_07738 [Thraustotheca clavata]|uniref:Uncharacterized protein n=1 Tax=Thraustotheca clavata TaxID=74557 RepID=A0A1V9ZCD9_9STRA|nr:hypothetical protein THRCLA_07738 [Thraustotheca clavata]